MRREPDTRRSSRRSTPVRTGGRHETGGARRRGGLEVRRAQGELPRPHLGGGQGVLRFDARLARLPDEVAVADRKSTRLNSSHSQISYAVFCLKKKKRTH